jgi:hypothetical protein
VTKGKQPAPMALADLLMRPALALLLVPALALGAVLIVFSVQYELAAGESRLSLASRATMEMLETLLIGRSKALAAVAQDIDGRALSSENSGAIRAELDRLRLYAPEFATALVADAEGRIVAGSPERLDPGTGISVWSGNDVSDREYFLEGLRSPGGYISSAFVGRSFGDDLLVALSLPIHGDDGEPAGIVEGSMTLKVVEEWLRVALPEAGVEYLLLDRSNTVLAATASLDVELMAPFAAEALAAWPVTASVPGWSRSKPYLSRVQETQSGWRLIVFVSDAVLLTSLIQRLAFVLAVLCLAIGLLYLARHRLRASIVQEVGRTVGFIEAATEATLSGGAVHPAMRTMVTSEGALVVDSLNRLGDRLRAAFFDLEAKAEQERALRETLDRTIANQDRMIAERTGELTRLNADLIKTQQFLRGAERAGRVGFWEMDSLAGPGHLSDGALALLGVAGNGQSSMSLSVLAAGLGGEDRGKVEVAKARAWFEGRDIDLDVEYRNEQMLAPIRLKLVARVVRGHDGMSQHLVGALMDITSLHKSEQRRMFLADSLCGLIAILNNPGLSDVAKVVRLLAIARDIVGAKTVHLPPGGGLPDAIADACRRHSWVSLGDGEQATSDTVGHATAGTGAQPLFELCGDDSQVTIVCRIPLAGNQYQPFNLRFPVVLELDEVNGVILSSVLSTLGALFGRVQARNLPSGGFAAIDPRRSDFPEWENGLL